MPMTLISRTTLTTTAASVTFNSIPQTFQTLKLVISARTENTASGPNDNIQLNFNRSSSNLSARQLYGTGTSAGSGTLGTQIYAGYVPSSLNATANTFGSSEITIPNYSGATNKPVSVDGVSESNIAGMYQDIDAGLWSNTSAITSITIVTTYSIASGSTFSLYGVS